MLESSKKTKGTHFALHVCQESMDDPTRPLAVTAMTVKLAHIQMKSGVQHHVTHQLQVPLFLVAEQRQ
jgi:hypothetical protein